MKQDNCCFHSRFVPQVTFRSHVLFCYLPWPPFTLPSLLPDAAGTAHSPTASPGGDGKRKILTSKNYMVRWNNVTAIGLVQVSDKVTVSSLKPATKAVCFRTPPALLYSHKVDGENLELQCCPAPWPGLHSALWHQAPFSSCAQRPLIPTPMNLIWKASSTPTTSKIGRSSACYCSPPQIGFVRTDEQNKSLA